jgi:hypothetical protein
MAASHRRTEMVEKKGIAFAALALLLAGCVGQRLEQGLAPLLGEDITVAVAKLGYPTARRSNLGETIYTWNRQALTLLPVAIDIPTLGGAANRRASGTATSENFIPLTFNCMIELAVNATNKIKNYVWQGDPSGCVPYARALNAK